MGQVEAVVPLNARPTGGAHHDQAEEAWQRHRLSQRAPAIIVTYAVVYTLLAWDFIMSLTPEWVSTLFGWWFFMGAFLSGTRHQHSRRVAHPALSVARAPPRLGSEN